VYPEMPRAVTVGSWLVRLPAADCDPRTIGGKGASLNRLLQLGLPVPPAILLRTEAYRDHVARPEVREAIRNLEETPSAEQPDALRRIREAIVTSDLDHDLARALDLASAELGAPRLAVRSSAIGEDSAASSFAGQYDSILGVDCGEPCREAVRRCWASLWSERAVAYRQRLGHRSCAPAMAVVIQRCVPAEVAGVLFTRDPVSGVSDRLLIEATLGLGEALVSGRVSPDRIVLDRRDLSVVGCTTGSKTFEIVLDRERGTRREAVAPDRATTPCIDADLASRLARLGLQVEEALGAAQDVEWAVADGEIALLQTRPITALPVAGDSADTRVWSNMNAGELLPDVATPMTFSIIERIVAGLLHPFFRRLGIDLGDLPLLGRIGGRIYFNVTTMAAVLYRIPGMAGRDVVDLFGGDREGLAAAARFLDHQHLPRVSVRPWRALLSAPGALLWLLRAVRISGSEALARCRRRTAALAALSSSQLTDHELLARIASAADDLLDPPDLVAQAIVGMACADRLRASCRNWLDDADGSITGRLLAGVGGMESAEAGLDLWRLVEEVRALPDPEAALRNGSFAEARATLSETDAGQRFLSSWDSFMARHGHHTRAEVDVSVPRWQEQPDYVWSLVRSYLEAGAGWDPIAVHRRSTAERLSLTEISCRRLGGGLRRKLFEWLLEYAQRGLALREASKSEMVRRLALVRASLLELGARLRERGALSQADDVFFVSLDELAGLMCGEITAAHVRVAAKRAEHAEFQRLTPPPVVIGHFEPTRDGALPKESAAMPFVIPAKAGIHSQAPPRLDTRLRGYDGPTVATFWAKPRDGVDAVQPSAGSGIVLRGIGVSPGAAVGRARVVLHSDAQERLRPGEILVAPFTDPGWTPYFLPAAAIVVDLGGVLSHGSVVAREYGIPAVVNVSTGTRTIRTGQLLRVDGTRGEVRLLME
jgi:phosphohistidine swiveling domain-containing protein